MYLSDGSEDSFVPDEEEAVKVTKKKAVAPASKTKTPAKLKTASKKAASVSQTPSTTSTRETTPSAKTNASETYQKLSQLEHILKRPDTYIGSIEREPMEMWTFDTETEQMVFKNVNIVPGLYKIFDEILVNAADNKIRDPSMKNLKVKIDPATNVIEVMNDGKGIPVEIHDKEKMYIPELIFGNLLTSSNYDDNEKKVTGGRNGYGAKLCNIFSTEFILETADLSNKKLYVQTWTDNMSNVSKPKITTLKTKKEYTKVTFKPDLAKFNMDVLDAELLSVLYRRVYDLCGTVKDCNIYLNDKKLNIRNFKAYVEMYVNAIKLRNSADDLLDDDKTYKTIIHEVVNDRWEVAFAVSDGSFNQVSFVNSIATTSGGTHVKYLADQIITKVTDALNKKEKGKKKLLIKPQDVRNNMFLFINCLIENPAFTSQTKEQLTTRSNQFGGTKVTIGDNFIANVLKTKLSEKIRNIADANADKELQKADGSRKQRIKGQTKLHDANKAGTKLGYQCTLILTEGDSALSNAVAGLAVVGRDYYGCFPLRGKMLNVREASAEQISKNAEINAMKQIIGLKHKKVYTPEDVKTLRYGHIMIMTDQDQDGSHIKGLIINFLESSFPGLLEIPGFLLEFITPIVKVTVSKRGGGKTVIPFFSMPEFQLWRESQGQDCRWTLKYYKGLGTSKEEEFRQYFQALDKHMKKFHALQGQDREYIELAFSKKKADDRKEWLQGYVPGTHLPPELNEIPISEFINKELIVFSMADNVRSIPLVIDGLKPGQRKVMYACFKRKQKAEMKVAQLAAYVAEKTQYHHGEQALQQTIIGLAQNFVGSNNINLLTPNGNFGSRAFGGKDYAAARYIFTELNKLTKHVFNPLDADLLNYIQEDEQTVEPEWYVPVLPMLLVNGAEGIGTGWSTNIPQYNPIEIVDNLKRMMIGEEMKEMFPWYKGWTGEIERSGLDKFRIIGRIEEVNENELLISELPVKMWTNTMKEYLLTALGTDKVPAWIKDVEEQHDSHIKFVVKVSDEQMAKCKGAGLLEKFKLLGSISVGNMVAFDPNGKIKKYESPLDMLKDFYYVRLDYYQKRKDYMSKDLQNQLTRLSEQARFIKLIIEKKISVSNKKRAILVKLLEENNFVKFDKGQPIEDEQKIVTGDDADLELEEEEELDAEGEVMDDDDDAAGNKPTTIYSVYDYLLGMSLWSLSKERYEKLLKQRDEKERELNELLGKTAKDLWVADLDTFMAAYAQFMKEDEEARLACIPTKGVSKKARKPRVKRAITGTDGKEEPATKKAKVKQEARSKTPSTVSTTRESTPVAIKKEPQSKPKAKQQDTILSFFGGTPQKTTAPTKSKSLFDDDSDSDVMEVDSTLLSHTASMSSDTKMTTPPAPKSNKNPVEDDLSTDLVGTAPTGRKRAPKKVSYNFSFTDSESNNGSDAEEEYVDSD